MLIDAASEKARKNGTGAPAAATQAETVLFSLSPRERDLFLPHLGDDFLSDQTTWLNTESYRTPEKWTARLREIRPSVMVSCWSTPVLPLRMLADGSLPLKYVCHLTGTVRSLVPREFIASGGLVTNWGSITSQGVAEHALMLTLTCLRNMSQWYRTGDRGPASFANARGLETRSLHGKKVGLHGFGNVAQHLVRLLKPFNVECMAYSRNMPPALIEEHGVTPCTDLKDINVARGEIADEAALAEAVSAGRIRAALDVFVHEPLPANSPLHDVEALILSPHIAGPTGEMYTRLGDFAVNNVNRFLAGEIPEGVVTLEIYDRST